MMAAPLAGGGRRSRLGRYVRSFPVRVKEPSFWLVQVGIVVATALHLALEAFSALEGTIPEGFHHVPVTLFLVPIIYAGLRYGFEGALLTGAVVGLLSVPNMVLWHRPDFAWLGELAYLTVVVSLGVVVSMPVERERREWARAEQNSRRLSLVNQVATTLSRSPDMERALESALTTTKEVMGLQAASIVADGAERGEAERDVPIEVEGRRLGVLRMTTDGPLTGEEEDLVASIAAQFGVAIENDRLRRLENERLKTYAQRMTGAQEEERMRIARDLHDDVAQALIVVCRALERVEADERCGLPAEIGDVHRQARAVLQTIRRFGRDLRPQLIDDLGLVPALEWLVTDLADRTGIDAPMSVEGSVRRLASSTAVSLFRVAQEALKNVEKHSGARSVLVTVRFQFDSIEVEVFDDGRGFESYSHDPLGVEGGWGMLGMEERMKLVGGRLDFSSTPGQGTRVTATAPAPVPGS